MRKILITLTVLFAAIDIMAQEHLSFKGIPIEGSMTEFCQKLKSKGFTSIGRENNITLFSGDFTALCDILDCEISDVIEGAVA